MLKQKSIMQMDLTNEHCGYSKKASMNMGDMDHIAHLNNSRNVFRIKTSQARHAVNLFIQN